MLYFTSPSSSEDGFLLRMNAKKKFIVFQTQTKCGGYISKLEN